MATAFGLTEEQCQALAGVQLGDAILSYPLPSQHARYDSEDEEDEEYEDESESEDASGDGERSEAEEEDTSSETEEDESRVQGLPAHLLVVTSITTDTTEITDGSSTIEVAILEYDIDLTGKLATYRLDGKFCRINNEAKTAESTQTIANVVNSGNGLIVKPDGDVVRRVLFHSRCPAGCNQGWLANAAAITDVMPDWASLTTMEHRPVCPSCIGSDLLIEQQSLMGSLDLGAIVEHVGELNKRRRSELYYSFKQLDEREWGFLFDDMTSDDDEDENGDDSAQYQQWEEAMDPNNPANVKTRPAADTAIASLPRKLFKDLTSAEAGDCLICTESYDAEQVVIELPCQHFYHDQCVETWLKQFNSCPTCREPLPAAAESAKAKTPAKEDGVQEVVTAMSELNSSTVSEAGDGDGDIAMQDV